jgi:predicted ArsR family transcriptional regulator
MDTKALSQSIGDLTSSLGDPTRRGIYITVREAPEPATASQIADLFSIHPNVARHHLDRLAEDGYLEVTRRRPDGKSGPGAGRPAKCYTATTKEIDLHFPARRYDLLSELLVRVIERIDPGNLADIAADIGREYGSEIASEIGAPSESGFDTAVNAVALAMTGMGFATDSDADTRRLLTSHCPFADTAVKHPEVVCSLDRGIVSGLMEGLSLDWRPVQVVSHPGLAEDCVAQV